MRHKYLILRKQRMPLIIKLFILLITPFCVDAYNFITISDIHLNNNQSHIMRLDPARYNEDNDMDLQSFFEISHAIKHSIGEGKLIPVVPDFILHLGDMIGHRRTWESNRTKLVEENQQIVLSTLQDIFPQTPIVTVFGNNDGFEKDYGRFTYKGMSPFNTAVQYGFKNGFLSDGEVCNGKLHSQYPCILSQNKIDGFFTLKLQKNLILIALNSVALSPYYKERSQKTAKLQMKFFHKHLELARVNKMSVLIAMHIPVGKNVYDGTLFWKSSHRDKFLELIMEYQNQIMGLLVGHTHMEEFKIITTTNEKVIGEFFTAGLSTSHGNSPSIKLFELIDQKDEWSIHNYIAYQIHPGPQEDEPVISKYYDFRAAYCESFPRQANIDTCLSHIKFNQTRHRFTVNNPNFEQDIVSPDAFYVN